MLGPLGRGSVPVKRHARRRVVTVVVGVLVLALFIGEIADQVVKAATPASRRSASSWVAAIAPILSESTSLAPTLRQLRSLSGLPTCGAKGCKRTSFDGLLDQLVSGTASDIAQLDQVGLVPTSKRSGSLIVAVLAERAKASQAVAGAAALLLGPSRTGVTFARAQALLLTAGSELTAADSDYRDLVASIPRRLGAPKLRPSVWVDDAQPWSRIAIQTWSDRLAASTGLESNASIVLLAVSTSPPALRIKDLPAPPLKHTSPSTSTTSTTTTTTVSTVRGATTTTSTTTTTTTTTTVPPTTTTLQLPPAGSVSVLAPTSELVVQVVVADAGNVSASTVTVEAVIEPKSAPAGSLPMASVTHHLSPLSPGDARYLSLGPMVVTKGRTYALTVSATVPGWVPAVDRITIEVAD